MKKCSGIIMESNKEFMNLIIKKCLINFPDKVSTWNDVKTNSDDLRSSLAYDLYKRLKAEGFIVYPVDLNLKVKI